MMCHHGFALSPKRCFFSCSKASGNGCVRTASNRMSSHRRQSHTYLTREQCGLGFKTPKQIAWILCQDGQMVAMVTLASDWYL